MSDRLSSSSRLVTVFGGSGFLGSSVVRALTKRNCRVRVAVRRPNLALHVVPFGSTGQVQPVQANLRYPDSVARAVAGADAVVNLVGILHDSGRQTFEAVQAEGSAEVARAAAAAGITRFVQVSALGADAGSPSRYASTKAQGEAAVLAAVPGAVILRPSVVFGPGDGLFGRFASLARLLPVLPLAGATSRLQPVYAGDVAAAIGKALDGEARGGRVYELGGPEIKTLREIVDFVLATIERQRLVVALPPALAEMQARALEIADMASFGLMPEMLRLTRDQLRLLEHDNVVSAQAEAEGRTLKGLGIVPTSYEAIVPAYLTRFRKTGQFAVKPLPVDEARAVSARATRP